MPHAKFRADPLNTVAVHKEQRTDTQAFSVFYTMKGTVIIGIYIATKVPKMPKTLKIKEKDCARGGIRLRLRKCCMPGSLATTTLTINAVVGCKSFKTLTTPIITQHLSASLGVPTCFEAHTGDRG